MRHGSVARFILICSSLLFLFSPAAAKTGFSIVGRVVDRETGQAVPHAEVLVYPSGTDSLARGTTTDEQGAFFLVRLASGSYDIKVQVMGYESHWVRRVTLGDETPRAELKRIELRPSVLSLPTVEMRAERSELRIAPDKVVYRVGKDITAAGGSVSEALENVPSVTVDVEGNVSLRGNQNVRILIDGKPSSRLGLNSAEALQQLPANQLDRIEVITNPSAKYDAEGVAGIINIVLKKERRRGLNGTLEASTGVPARYGASANVNYRYRKINYFLNEGIKYRSDIGGGSSHQRFYGDAPYNILDGEREINRKRWSNIVKPGIELFLDKQNTFTVSAYHYYGEDDNRMDINYRYYDLDENLLSRSVRNTPEDEMDRWYGTDMGYKHTFNDKGHELTADFKMETGSEREHSTVEERVYGVLPGVTDQPARQQDVSSLQDESSGLFQVDYTNPFSEVGKVELGVKSRFRDLTHEYIVDEILEDGQANRLDYFTNDLRYREGIHAAYATYQNRAGSLSYQLGLRGEYSDINTEYRTTNDTYRREYFDLFPSVSLARDFSKANSLQLSYSRRLNRPRFWFLIPFWNYADSKNIRRGNPKLDPEYTQSFEVKNLRTGKTGTVSASLYYRHTDGVIEFLQTAVDSLVIGEPHNLSTRDSYGIELIASRRFGRWLTLQGNGNFFRAITDGTVEGENLESDTYSWFARLSARVNFNHASQLQARFFYRGPRNTVQGKRKAIYAFDLAASRSILQGKTSITLGVRDLFNTRRMSMETFADSFYSKMDFRRRSRTFALTVTYRFNQDRRKQRERNLEIDLLQERGEGPE